MDAAQAASWHALLDLYTMVPEGWTLVGGQLVHLHCAERGHVSPRPTTDADAVVNIRADQRMLARFTQALGELGFSPVTSGSGHQHRWINGLAQVDVLIPEGVGERAAKLQGIGGAPTIASPGTTQALARTGALDVVVEGRSGRVLRPNLVGALVLKAAVRLDLGGQEAASRHCVDFVVLASLLAARDVRESPLDRKDRQRLRGMITLCRTDEPAMRVAEAGEYLARLQRAIDL